MKLSQIEALASCCVRSGVCMVEVESGDSTLLLRFGEVPQDPAPQGAVDDVAASASSDALIDVVRQAMQRLQLAELRIGCAGHVVHAIRSQAAAARSPASEARPVRLVGAPFAGAFQAQHPLARRQPPSPGEPVLPGQHLGVITCGTVLLPVVAPCPGILAAPLPPDGVLLGFGDTVARIEEL